MSVIFGALLLKYFHIKWVPLTFGDSKTDKDHMSKKVHWKRNQFQRMKKNLKSLSTKSPRQNFTFKVHLHSNGTGAAKEIQVTISKPFSFSCKSCTKMRTGCPNPFREGQLEKFECYQNVDDRIPQNCEFMIFYFRNARKRMASLTSPHWEG